jgi:hypothetical protein
VYKGFGIKGFYLGHVVALKVFGERKPGSLCFQEKFDIVEQ